MEINHGCLVHIMQHRMGVGRSFEYQGDIDISISRIITSTTMLSYPTN